MAMTNRNQENIFDPNKTEIISLMISHIKGELSPTCELKMDNLIENCAECKKLYKEVTSFFEPSNVLLYEIENQAKINKLRQLVYKLGDIYDNNRTETEDEICENKFKDVLEIIENTDKYCYG